MSQVQQLVSKFNSVFGETGGPHLEGVSDTNGPVAEARRISEAYQRGEAINRRQVAQLEAVIHTEGYPSLAVDGPLQFPMRWKTLNRAAYKSAIQSALLSVGRIEAPANDGRRFLGTGWAIAPGMIITNRHVAREFVNDMSVPYTFVPHVRPEINWAHLTDPDPLSETDSAPCRILSVALLHPRWDVALLTIAQEKRPLGIIEDKPGAPMGWMVALLGYPETDPHLNADVAREVFGGRFGVKRVAPGNIRAVDATLEVEDEGRSWVVNGLLAHDASTLGGCSGAAALCLPERDASEEAPPWFGKVIGLHCAGTANTSNYAIPMWTLQEDAEFRKALMGPGFAPAPSAVARPAEQTGETHPSACCDEAGGVLPSGELDALEVRTLSGESWVHRYPLSASLLTLNTSFRRRVELFIQALRGVGARVDVLATWRPPERAYLMRWAWMVARQQVAPASVPSRPGVPILWSHGSLDDSIAAAEAMVEGFGLLEETPLTSRHTEGRAVDLLIELTQTVEIVGPDLSVHVLKPGDPEALRGAGAAFGLVRSPVAPTHWSEDGS